MANQEHRILLQQWEGPRLARDGIKVHPQPNQGSSGSQNPSYDLPMKSLIIYPYIRGPPTYSSVNNYNIYFVIYIIIVYLKTINNVPYITLQNTITRKLSFFMRGGGKVKIHWLSLPYSVSSVSTDLESKFSKDQFKILIYKLILF